MEYDPHEAIGYIYTTAPQYAKAKGQLAQLEAYKHSLRAIKMKQSNEQTVTAQEREAYASPQYKNHCKQIAEATFEAELLKLKIKCAELRWETWRTQQANERQFDKMIRNQ